MRNANYKQPRHPEDEREPYWRAHDSSLAFERDEDLPPPARDLRKLRRTDPDWDDSHWNLGSHLWLGHENHPHGPWQKVKNFFGVGPKNYRRPDSVIYDEVCEALAHEPEVDASEIEVKVEDGHVILEGRVHDRWMKRQAEDAIYFLPGVVDVRNKLEWRGKESPP